MRAKLSIIITIALVSCINTLYSQEPCKVLKPELEGKYTGKCKKGLAHGKGVAEGKDKYEGRFKNGLPDGEGKYTWSNGVVYEGSWENGNRNGKGTLYFNINGIDSMRIGYWKDDKFVRKFIPNPYTILRSTNLVRYSVRRVSDGDKVLFSFKQAGTENQGIYGFNIYSTSGTSFSIGPKPGFEKITYPATFKISYNTQNRMKTTTFSVEFDILIIEPGSWEVELEN